MDLCGTAAAFLRSGSRYSRIVYLTSLLANTGLILLRFDTKSRLCRIGLVSVAAVFIDSLSATP